MPWHLFLGREADRGFGVEFLSSFLRFRQQVLDSIEYPLGFRGVTCSLILLSLIRLYY